MTDTNDYKWLIPSSQNLGSKSLEEEKALWDNNHEDYTNTAFSITQDPKICKNLIRPERSPGYDIPNSPDIKVLIPG
ncbi:MAG: class I SAM-dependent methyltransferase, partial [Oscillatoriales cyanobacterium]